MTKILCAWSKIKPLDQQIRRREYGHRRQHKTVFCFYRMCRITILYILIYNDRRYIDFAAIQHILPVLIPTFHLIYNKPHLIKRAKATGKTPSVLCKSRKETARLPSCPIYCRSLRWAGHDLSFRRSIISSQAPSTFLSTKY